MSIAAIALKLKSKYNDFDHHNKKKPLDELFFILCSVKRSEQVYLRAYKSLKQAFPTYNQINRASVKKLSSQICWGGMQNQKSRSLKTLVTALTENFGRPTLAPLHKMTEVECEKFLCSLPGVGKKVARCVMMYSLNKRVFPVDTHCWRISKRLGWLKSEGNRKFCSSRDMDFLQEIIPPRLRLSLHVNMVSLGRDSCKAQSPRCGSCVITSYCPKVGVNHAML